MSMSVFIRPVRVGDEDALAHIQTESWRAAFGGILDKDTLNRCTDMERARAPLTKGSLREQGCAGGADFIARGRDGGGRV